MKKEDCYHLGSIVRLHGFKGEVSILLDVTSPEDYKKLESVFVEINKQLVPFFIDKIQLTNKNFARVKFEGVDREEDAKNIVKKTLFLPLNNLPQLSGTSFYDHEVIGYHVFDQKHGAIGQIIQILDLPNNPLIEINNGKGCEILVPLKSDTVTQLCRTKREMHVQTPKGLIELYIEPSNSDNEDA